ncbi:MAG TPA: hypothetical protein VNH20_05470 [Candidatus Dormibacteraeota bacterium]|nr:hypothetical protein [Candidatus Dormibacteraeota bacterium]
MKRWPGAFGRFCYEFVVGDTPELAVGVAVVIVGAWALSRPLGGADFWFVPLAVVLLLAASLWRGVRMSGR